MPRYLTILLCSSFIMSSAYADDVLQQRADKSADAVKEFMGQLKAELQTAMKAGGPLNAIDICNKQAPEIARQLSDKYGWEIARTSLKTRNSANAPDAWETDVLQAFEQRKASGEAVKPMAYFEAIEKQGTKQFRYMKAIPTGKVCLNCHGSEISAEVKAKIQSLYAEDRAVDYKLGDIRGAFTISQPW